MKKPCTECDGRGCINRYSSVKEYLDDPATHKSLFDSCSACRGLGYIDKESDNILKIIQIVPFISIPLGLLVIYFNCYHIVPNLVCLVLNMVNWVLISTQWCLGFKLNRIRKRNRYIDSITEELIK